MNEAEASASFDCFGSTCTVHVIGATGAASAAEAVAAARERLLAGHQQFSRFLADSELSLLNADPRATLPVSPEMARLALAVERAGSLTAGLVDGTLGAQIERAGYTGEQGPPIALVDALSRAPGRKPASERPARAWRELEVDRAAGTLTRPPGLRLDSGGLVKGLLADALGETLAVHRSYAVNCAGDLALGGRAGLRRAVEVESPFDGRTLHTFNLSSGGVATSGIGRRSWLDGAGRPAHHLLDPATGLPAYTGVVQVTALAADALTAEIYAKAAILSGPRGARRWLPEGGVVVLDDGSHRVIDPPRRIALSELSGFAQRDQSGLAEHA